MHSKASCVTSTGKTASVSVEGDQFSCPSAWRSSDNRVASSPQLAGALHSGFQERVDGLRPLRLLAPFGLARRDERAAPRPTLGERGFAERLVNTFGGRTRDPQLSRQLTNGWEPVAGMKTTRDQVCFRLLLYLRCEGQAAMAIQQKAHVIGRT